MKHLEESFPSSFYPVDVLNTIGENIILADPDYKIVWFNPTAYDLFSKIGPLFGISQPEAFIGLTMDRFHKTPSYQRAIMATLTSVHRMRISIKDTYIADIVINPIKDKADQIQGYVVMLMDVTTMAQEEHRKDQLIQELSVPLLHIWDHMMAVPITGPLDDERFDRILTTLLKACQKNKTKYMVIDFSGITKWNDSVAYQLDRTINSLRLIGTECLVVGVKPELAYNLVNGFTFDSTVRLYSSVKEAIRFVMSLK